MNADIKSPYYWCRKCRHHLTAHRLIGGRVACEGCDSIHSGFWRDMEKLGIAARTNPSAAPRPESFHEYSPGNHLTAWLSRNERQWGPALFFCAIIVALVVVGRML